MGTCLSHRQNKIKILIDHFDLDNALPSEIIKWIQQHFIITKRLQLLFNYMNDSTFIRNEQRFYFFDGSYFIYTVFYHDNEVIRMACLLRLSSTLVK